MLKSHIRIYERQCKFFFFVSSLHMFFLTLNHNRVSKLLKSICHPEQVIEDIEAG